MWSISTWATDLLLITPVVGSMVFDASNVSAKSFTKAQSQLSSQAYIESKVPHKSKLYCEKAPLCSLKPESREKFMMGEYKLRSLTY